MEVANLKIIILAYEYDCSWGLKEFLSIGSCFAVILNIFLPDFFLHRFGAMVLLLELLEIVRLVIFD